MALNQILTGNEIMAQDLIDELNAIKALLPIRARSIVATTWISDTAFKNVTGLACAMAANQVYKLRGRIKVTGANTTHDIKMQMSLPASATVEWSAYNGAAGTVTNAINAIDTGSTGGIHIRGTFAGTLTIPIEGTITVAGTAGNAQLQAAQNVSDPGTLSVDAGSEMNLQLWV